MSIASLERDDHSVTYFRVSYDLGTAVEAHLGSLSATLDGEPLFDYLSRMSKSWMDSHVIPFAGRNYLENLEFVRYQILGQKVGASTHAQKVYEALAAAVVPVTPTELSARLDALGAEAFQLVGEAIKRFGGEQSNRRWQMCTAAHLVFDHGEDAPTRMSFDSGPPCSITIHIGSHINSDTDRRKGALRVYFISKFYFFHEYFSHSFAVWQEEKFVEGYLVWAAKNLLNELTQDSLRHQFVEDTFSEMALPPRPPNRVAERVAEWFDFTSQRRFIPYLLEWAAEPEPEGEAADLEAMFQLSERAQLSRQVSDDVRVAFDDPDYRLVRRRLRILAQQSAGLPRFPWRLQRG